jgi:hypothetical protein
MALGDQIVSDDAPLSPVDYEGLDPTAEPKSTATDVSQTLKDAMRRAKGAIEAGRRPGMPLSVLSNVAREAPLGSLLLAFLLGIAVGRRARF